MQKLLLRLAKKCGSENVASSEQGPAHITEEEAEAYYFRRLSPARRKAVTEHAVVCVACFQQLQQHRLAGGILKQALRRGNSNPHSRIVPPKTTRGRSLTRDRFLAAQETLPVSQYVVGRCLTAINDRHASLEILGNIVAQDPVIAAHLVAAANSALLARREISSLSSALAHLGLDRVRLHILGASLKSTFARPALRRLWDHSVSVASLSRDLAERCRMPNPETACLAGLVHDLGTVLVAASLPNEAKLLTEIQETGEFPVEAERSLFGADHADLGANLLSSWFFPRDLVEAVRYHHAPCLSELPLTSLLYLAELFIGSEEAYYHPAEHALALKRLGLSVTSLHGLGTGIHPDLQTLQLAA